MSVDLPKEMVDGWWGDETDETETVFDLSPEYHSKFPWMYKNLGASYYYQSWYGPPTPPAYEVAAKNALKLGAEEFAKKFPWMQYAKFDIIVVKPNPTKLALDVCLIVYLYLISSVSDGKACYTPYVYQVTGYMDIYMISASFSTDYVQATINNLLISCGDLDAKIKTLSDKFPGIEPVLNKKFVDGAMVYALLP